MNKYVSFLNKVIFIISRNIKLSILTKPRIIKRFIVISMDLVLSIVAVWLAFYLRVGEFLPLWEQQKEHYLLPACIAAILVSTLVFNYFHLCKVIFRFLGSQLMIIISKAFLVYGIIYAIIFTVIGVAGVPRTIGVIQPLIFFILISFTRFFAANYLGNIYEKNSIKEKKKEVIIYGAGTRGYHLSRSLYKNSKINIICFFDDDVSLHGNRINNIDILNPKEIDKLITSKNVSEIIFAFDSKNSNKLKKAMDQLKGRNLVLRTLPSYDDLVADNTNVNSIKELSIDDILGREPISPNPNLMKEDIANKVVLVSGAGGSIGSELCRQIYIYKPKKLILLDHSEFALFTIYEELKSISKINNKTEIVSSLSSITNKKEVSKILKNMKPYIIFHAAAYKHVSLIEKNKIAGLNNNIFGTLFLSQLAIENNVEKFVLISTDKAVRPSNIMGKTKRVAEMIIQALSTTQNQTLFSIVRFGNVLGSSGSVVPIFKSQIKSGGPITITHPDITRYFMTITEAAQLVIQAGAMTKSHPKLGQAAPVYLLDMGYPVKILDLAKIMIKLYGLSLKDKNNINGDIEIKIIGLRPGEKIHEELLIGQTSKKTKHPKIKFTSEVFLEWQEMEKVLLSLKKAILKNDERLITELILQRIPSVSEI